MLYEILITLFIFSFPFSLFLKIRTDGALISIAGFNELNKEQLKTICNGCGASGVPKWVNWLLDNVMGIGTDVKLAGDRHDVCYYKFKMFYGKIWGDFIFFINILLIYYYQIWELPLKEFFGGLCVLPLGIVRAIFYYIAVSLFGFKPFYKGKNVNKILKGWVISGKEKRRTGGRRNNGRN